MQNFGVEKEQFRFFSLTSAVDWGNIKDGFLGEGNCRLGGLGVCGGYQGTLECQERRAVKKNSSTSNLFCIEPAFEFQS